MPRRPRVASKGYVYHVLNRAVGRQTLFRKDGDYVAFEAVLYETAQRKPGVDALAYCVMPNHWHLLLRPTQDDALSNFMRLLTLTHTQRYHAHHGTAGTGPLYQGRFKSFPVQSDEHFLTVARYVEQNAVRAALVDRAEHWPWSSLWARREGDGEVQAILKPWPVPGGVPRQWLRTVNAPQPEAQLADVRQSVRRGRPYGEDGWVRQTASKLDLASSLRSPGRPKKAAN